MSETLYIGSDINTAETKVLFDELDFADIVEERLGYDARKYMESLLVRGRADGYEDGYKDGYASGYNDGYED